MVYGYGIRLDSMDPAKIHMHELLKYLPEDLADDYNEFLTDNKAEDNEESFAGFVGEYQSTIGSSYGLSALLADLITEYDQITVQSDGGCLYLVPLYPWQMEFIMKTLSRNGFENIIRKWIHIVYDGTLELISFDWDPAE